MGLNYERDMEIDETGLDVEWLSQPRLTMKYAKHAAETKRLADMAKEKLEVIKSTLDLAIRTDPAAYGVTKITESAIQSVITLSPEYQKVNQDAIDARYEQDMARYATQAVNDRKDALENLVRLHGVQYFAGPRIPRDLDKEWEAKIKQDEINSKIKIKRRKEIA